MCELLGISCDRPASFARELSAFRLRGGLTADNPDGWGLAWWDGSDFPVVKEPSPAHLSARLPALADEVRSGLLVAHVRKARFPPVRAASNTHPFRHVCCGRPWVFAHNGLVPEVVDLEQGNAHPVCRPAGETDSEFAFCHLLDHIARGFDGPASLDAPGLLSALGAVSEAVARYGKFNFLLSDGACLIAYGHDRLHHRETGEGSAACAVVATEPLPGMDGWQPFAPGELRIYREGRLAGRSVARPRADAAA